MVSPTVKLAGALLLASAATVSAKSVGCGIGHTVGYNSNGGQGFDLASGSTTRKYSVRVPDNYDSQRLYPLIVDYHGRGGSSQSQYETSQYDHFDATNWIVVYPQGQDMSWEGASYHDDADAEGYDDLKFTTDLVNHMQAQYCVDSARVYASGKSNGGGFVGTLACSSAGGQFAAFALSSAALYTDNFDTSDPNYRVCKPARSILPIMEFHGSADSVISYNGGAGAGGRTPAIPNWLNNAWAVRNGAGAGTSDYGHDQYGSRVNMTTFKHGGNTVVTGWWINGMDHCWASTKANHDWDVQGASKCVAPLNATSIILSYFDQWDVNGRR